MDGAPSRDDDDDFRAQLRKNCASQAMVDACLNFTNEVGMRSYTCAKAPTVEQARLGFCDGIEAKSRVVHRRFEAIEMERASADHERRSLENQNAERSAASKAASAERVEQAKRNLQEWLQNATGECSKTLSADACRLAPAGNCELNMVGGL
jgi:hypothetical protein